MLSLYVILQDVEATKSTYDHHDPNDSSELKHVFMFNWKKELVILNGMGVVRKVNSEICFNFG